MSPVDVLMGSCWPRARLQPRLNPAETCLAVRELLPGEIGLRALRRGANVFSEDGVGQCGRV